MKTTKPLTPETMRIVVNFAHYYAHKHFTKWFCKPEELESDILLLVAENLDAVEQIWKTTHTEDYTEHVKGFKNKLAGFFKNKLYRYNQQLNSQRFEYIKNSPKGYVIDATVFEFVEEALASNFTVPSPVVDFWKLRHLRKSDAIAQVLHKHKISRRNFNEQKLNFVYRFLRMKDANQVLTFSGVPAATNILVKKDETSANFLRVMTIGSFDLFHEGHQNLINQMTTFSGNLIIGVNSDAFGEFYKRKPVRAETDRVEDVRAFCDDTLCLDNLEVFINTGFENQPKHILDHRPDIFVIGSDWADPVAFGKQLFLPSPADVWFKRHSISLVTIDRLPDISTTSLIQQQQQEQGEQL